MSFPQTLQTQFGLLFISGLSTIIPNIIYGMLLLMRYLGIDYGTKRVGLALSDEAGMMAFPLKVLPNDNELTANIVAVIDEKRVDEVVIGHSKDRTGEDNPVHAKAEELMTDLTLALGLPVHLEPEQYSTQEAIREQGRNEMTDAAAATIILNSFLTREK